MDNNTLQNNHIFSESSNLQQSTQPLREHSSNINYSIVNADFSVMNDNNIFTTPHTNTNQQTTSNENIVSTSKSYPSSYFPQYDHPIENIPPPLNGLNMTTINPSQSEIFSFDIPGFKIIVIPTFPQQDNIYSNYSSDINHITDNQYQR